MTDPRTNEELNSIIAKWHRWTPGHWEEWATVAVGEVKSGRIWASGKATGPGGEVRDAMPDYCRDLNACHEAEQGFMASSNPKYYREYLKNLSKGRWDFHPSARLECVFSTARQRAEALVWMIENTQD